MTTWQPSPTKQANVVEATFGDESFAAWVDAFASAAIRPDLTHLAIADDVARLAYYIIDLNPKRFGNLSRVVEELTRIQGCGVPQHRFECDGGDIPWPLPNLIPTAVIHNQADADRDLPILLGIPATKRAVIWTGGEVDFDPTGCELCESSENVVAGNGQPWCNDCDHEAGSFRGWLDGIDLIILRPGAAPVHLDHVRSVRDQCEAAGVAFWIEGLGNLTSSFDDWNETGQLDGELIDDVMHWRFETEGGTDPNRWPEDLQGCRQWPT